MDSGPFETVGKVYPSEEDTVLVMNPPGDIYGGAHLYAFTPCLGFNKGNTTYCDNTVEMIMLQFIQKNDDGTIIPGVQSEQVVLALIDRHKKMNNRFPSAQGIAQIATLEAFLELSKLRVDERIARDVMGELKR